MTRWTETDDQILRKLNAQGMTDQQIADQIGRTKRGVEDRRHHLRLEGNAAPNHRKMTSADVFLARALYRQGMTPAKIAGQIGRGREAIRLCTLDLANERYRTRESINEKIINLRVKGKLTGAEIAARLHMSRNQVLGVLHRAGIAAPGHHKPKTKFSLKAKSHEPTIKRDPYRGEAPTGCRYPEGDGASLKWCNAERRQGSPYCGHHHAVCHIQRPMLEAAE